VPFLAELHLMGYQAAHNCVIDESSGFRSEVYHRGWVKCTLISILRKHNCGNLSTGIFRECPMNCGTGYRYCLRSERLEILGCRRLAPKLLAVMKNWWQFEHISNNCSFRQKHPGVPDGSDGSDGPSYPLTENYTLPITQATGRGLQD
jgi:hypothetical protein